jgi:exosortase/archaeosortase family protein
MPNMQNSENRALQPGSAFAVTFILCVTTVAGLMSCIPDAYLVVWRDLTMLVTKGLGILLGLAMTSKADILTVNGFAMRIIGQCTAVDYVAILATAMLLYTRHSLAYRLLGLAIAVPAIVFANACRLIISGVVGTFSRSAFDFVHDYLWVIGFALIVFAIWTLWVNGRFVISRSAARRVAVIAFVSIATYALLLFIHDAYSNLIAYASSFFYKLINDDPLAAIVREGDMVVYSHAGTRFYLHSLLEQANVAIYVGLMVPLQKKGDWEMLGMTLFGLSTIVLMSAIFVALGCGHAVTFGAGSLIDFLEIGSFVHLALPMTIYWIMASERDKKDGRVA